MKKILFTGIAAAVLYSAPALAIDEEVREVYIGVHAGEFRASTKGTFAPHNPDFGWITDDKQVGFGGIHGGFQFRRGYIVAGVEGAWDAAFNSPYGSGIGGPLGTPCAFGVGNVCQARINDIIQVGPRFGFAVNNWMMYGTGGYARAMIDTRGFDPIANTAFSGASNHQDGWYLGGGFEVRTPFGLDLGVDFKHFAFGSAIQNVPGAPGDSRIVKANADALMTRVTWRGTFFDDGKSTFRVPPQPALPRLHRYE